jgi:RNA polymerase-associated protein LEO1
MEMCVCSLYCSLSVESDDHQQYWDLRLPPYVWADSRPFHPDTFQSIEPKETVTGSEAKNSLLIKMELANTIRWRWVKAADGSMVNWFIIGKQSG